MLNGIVKAAVIIGIAVVADFFTDGTYTDDALSMLRQTEHSFQ